MKLVSAARSLVNRLHAPAVVVYRHARDIYDALNSRGWREMVADRVDGARSTEAAVDDHHVIG